MIQNQELKTSTKQRVVIILIAILMFGSTVALYMGIVLSGGGASDPAANVDPAKQARLEELFAERQVEVDAQAAELSATYFDQFAGFRSEVKAFNAASVTELTSRDLRIGDGNEVVNDFYDYSAYYIGWISDETIFDSSLNDPASPTSLKSPLPGGQMIEGWNIGIVGMRIGGVREITIPANLAYGDQEQGVIPANSPLKFIVMLIPPAEEIPYSDELMNLYNEVYGATQQ